MYCTFDKYQLLGGGMRGEQFAVYGPRAARRIDALTQGRAARFADTLAAELAQANADMADLLLASDDGHRAAAGLTGFSNDGYSEQYADAKTARRALNAALADALREALGADPCGLLWQGVE